MTSPSSFISKLTVSHQNHQKEINLPPAWHRTLPSSPRTPARRKASSGSRQGGTGGQPPFFSSEPPPVILPSLLLVNESSDYAQVLCQVCIRSLISALFPRSQACFPPDTSELPRNITETSCLTQWLPTKLHKSHHRKQLNKQNECWGLRKRQNSHCQCNLNSIPYRKTVWSNESSAAESVLLTCDHCPVELKGAQQWPENQWIKFSSPGLLLDDCNSWELCKYLEHLMIMLFGHRFQFIKEAFILKTCPNSSRQ